MVMACLQPWRNMKGAVTSEIKKKELESPGGKEESVFEISFWLEVPNPVNGGTIH